RGGRDLLHKERSLGQGLKSSVVVAPSGELSAEARLRGRVMARSGGELVNQFPEMPRTRAFERHRVHDAVQGSGTRWLGGRRSMPSVFFHGLDDTRKPVKSGKLFRTAGAGDSLQHLAVVCPVRQA